MTQENVATQQEKTPTVLQVEKTLKQKLPSHINSDLPSIALKNLKNYEVEQDLTSSDIEDLKILLGKLEHLYLTRKEYEKALSGIIANIGHSAEEDDAFETDLDYISDLVEHTEEDFFTQEQQIENGSFEFVSDSSMMIAASFLDNSPIPKMPLKTIAKFKTYVHELILQSFKSVVYQPAYEVGFGKLYAIGIYDDDGFLIDAREAEKGETANFNWGKGDEFLND